MPTTEQQIEIQDERVTYRVVESERARKARIDVSMDGVKVVIPENASMDPEAILQENGAWVQKKRDQFAEYRDRIPERVFEEGKTFPVYGQPHILEVKSIAQSLVTDEAIQLAQSQVAKTSIRDELERAYRREARRYYTERADHYCEQMGVRYSQIQIRNQKTRWGSYSSRTGTLSLNWRLLMAPPEIIDYLIAHELAHAEHPNHSKRFWRFVAQHVPDYEAKDKWLKENGVRLTFTEADLG